MLPLALAISAPTIESFARFFSELACRNFFAQHRRWRKRWPEHARKVLRNSQSHIQANEVGEFKRPHRMPVTKFHRSIDIGWRSDTLFHHSHGFEANH